MHNCETYLITLIACTPHSQLDTDLPARCVGPERMPVVVHRVDGLFIFLAPAVVRSERQIRLCGVYLVCSFCIIEAGETYRSIDCSVKIMDWKMEWKMLKQLRERLIVYYVVACRLIHFI